MRQVEVHILKSGIEPILAMIVDELAAEVSFGRGVPIICAEERRQMETPVDMIALDRIRQALGIHNELP